MSLKNVGTMILNALTVKETWQIAWRFAKHQHVILAIYVPS